MTTTAMQQGEQRERQRGRPWPRGQSGNPAGSRLIIERRAAIEADLVRDLGGDLSPADHMLLSRGVELLCRKPRSHTDAVRLVNAGTRIIDKLRDKYTKRTPTDGASELDQYLRSRGGGDEGVE
jgi:hypothetical protein